MSDDQCQLCKFAADEQGGEALECRRYPPQNEHDDDGMLIIFTLVKHEMWCGEFSRRVN